MLGLLLLFSSCSPGVSANSALAPAATDPGEVPPSSEVIQDGGSDSAQDVLIDGPTEAVAQALDADAARWLALCDERESTPPKVRRQGSTPLGFPLEVLRAMLRRYARTDLEACAAAARARAPGRSTVLFLSFELAPDAGLEQLRVERDAGDPELRSCVLRALSRAPLPELARTRIHVSHAPIVLCASGTVRILPEPSER